MSLDILKKYWKEFRTAWKSYGGFKNPLLVILFLFFLKGLYAFAREMSLLPKKNLKGWHIFLTGAGQGLGRKLAVKLSKYGAKLTICDIHEGMVKETASMIKNQQNVLALSFDVCDRQGIAKAAQKAKDTFGDVDMIINNAGIVTGKEFTEMDEAMISKSMIINCECHFWIIKEFLPAMLKKNRGHIVSTASMAGISGLPNMGDYSASKFGAVGLMESLRIEMKRDKKNIRCTTICPYYIKTGMFDGAKDTWTFPMLEPEYVANRIVQAIRQDEDETCICWNNGFIVRYLGFFFPKGVTDQIYFMIIDGDTMANLKGRDNTHLKTDTPITGQKLALATSLAAKPAVSRL